MGADLPAADDNGLLDPYVKLGYRDQPKQLTRKLYGTRDPVWHQTFDFATVLSEDLRVAPPVSLKRMGRLRASFAYSHHALSGDAWPARRGVLQRASRKPFQQF